MTAWCIGAAGSIGLLWLARPDARTWFWTTYELVLWSVVFALMVSA